MSGFPDWVQPHVFVCHQPTKTVFRPAKRGRMHGQLVLLDPTGKDYPVDECDRLSLEDVQAGARLITAQAELTLIPCSNGFIATDGQRRYRVELPSEVVSAAQELANFFNGTIAFTEELNDGH